MKRVLTFGLAASCLLSAHCDAGKTEPKSSAPTPGSEPSIVVPGAALRSPGSRAPLLPIARIEGYGNPRTGELWARSVPVDAQPKDKQPSDDGVQASAQALAGSVPGYCAVTVKADGVPNSNPPGTFEFYTKGQLAGAPPEDLSSFDPVTCYDNLKPSEQSPLVLSLFETGTGVGCALQHVGNFSGVSYDHVYLDIDVFNGDEAMHGPYGAGYTTGTVATPGGRNAPNAARGLWDFGPMANNDLTDMWIYFKNGDTTDFNWTGYLLGERTEDCSNAIDDDCDGVVNNGCASAGAGFLGGAECFADEDCNSALCAGAEINSGFGKGGGDLSDDVPGHCMSAVGEACTTNAGCQTNYCFGADTCVYPGELEFALTWQDTTSDFDLHVRTPDDFDFHSGNLTGPNGQMDVHDCEGGVCRKPTGKHFEHVKLYPAPQGYFIYYVHNRDSAAGGSYTLQVLENGAVVATHSGTLTADEEGEHFKFRFPSACGDGIVNTGEECDSGPDTTPFVTDFTANNCVVAEHELITGDNRGGIAATNSRVLYTGDSGTASFDADDPGSSFQNWSPDVHDGLVTDRATRSLYLLGQGGSPLSLASTSVPVGQIDSLLGIDDYDGFPFGNFSLSDAIDVTTAGENGVFAGTGFIAILASPDDGNSYHLSLINTLSGEVKDIGALSISMSHCENWAAWGMADVINAEIYLTYVADSQTIVRTRVSDGSTVAVSNFTNLGDMCGIIDSPIKGRWYFHHDSASQFAPGGDETIGYCDASFSAPQDADPGCDSACSIVSGYTCSGEPSSCSDGGGGTCGSGVENSVASQFSESGYLCLNWSQRPGQSFTVPSDGVLTAIDLGLATCGTDPSTYGSVTMEVLRAGAVVATKTLYPGEMSTGCVSTLTTSPAHFDLSDDCATVTAGEQLVFRLRIDGVEPACVGEICQGGTFSGSPCTNDAECSSSACLAFFDTSGNPYAGGVEWINDVATDVSWDAQFEVFTSDTP